MTALSLGDAPVGEPGGETVMTPGVCIYQHQGSTGQTNSGERRVCRGHEATNNNSKKSDV